jgi:hypothetical protein
MAACASSRCRRFAGSVCLQAVDGYLLLFEPRNLPGVSDNLSGAAPTRSTRLCGPPRPARVPSRVRRVVEREGHAPSSLPRTARRRNPGSIRRSSRARGASDEPSIPSPPSELQKRSGRIDPNRANRSRTGCPRHSDPRDRSSAPWSFIGLTPRPPAASNVDAPASTLPRPPSRARHCQTARLGRANQSADVAMTLNRINTADSLSGSLVGATMGLTSTTTGVPEERREHRRPQHQHRPDDVPGTE